jgi:hypothetical protein
MLHKDCLRSVPITHCLLQKVDAEDDSEDSDLHQDGSGSLPQAGSLYNLPSGSCSHNKEGSLHNLLFRSGNLQQAGSLHNLHDDTADLYSQGSLHNLQLD